MASQNPCWAKAPPSFLKHWAGTTKGVGGGTVVPMVTVLGTPILERSRPCTHPRGASQHPLQSCKGPWGYLSGQALSHLQHKMHGFLEGIVHVIWEFQQSGIQWWETSSAKAPNENRIPPAPAQSWSFKRWAQTKEKGWAQTKKMAVRGGS
ncbi:UNVERIFIED_CONTAM: hypothetical protein K2H54_008343 [Gekko kuhli]